MLHSFIDTWPLGINLNTGWQHIYRPVFHQYQLLTQISVRQIAGIAVYWRMLNSWIILCSAHSLHHWLSVHSYCFILRNSTAAQEGNLPPVTSMKKVERPQFIVLVIKKESLWRTTSISLMVRTISYHGALQAAWTMDISQSISCVKMSSSRLHLQKFRLHTLYSNNHFDCVCSNNHFDCVQDNTYVFIMKNPALFEDNSCMPEWWSPHTAVYTSDTNEFF